MKKSITIRISEEVHEAIQIQAVRDKTNASELYEAGAIIVIEESKKNSKDKSKKFDK